MKFNTKAILVMFLASTVTATLCFAQSEVGQGGDAVLKNGKYYLLDLVEAGIETTGAIPPNYTQCPEIVTGAYTGTCGWYKDFEFSNTRFGAEVGQGVLNALTNIPDLDAMAILKTINLFDWNFVSIPLVDIRDVSTPIDLSNYPMYQLATRKDHTITINALIWNQLDTLNKVALITHEALYALVRPTADVNHPGMQMQDSYSARQFNYKLYHNESPRLRKEFTNNQFTFTPYTTAFGSYGESDDFIGNDVTDGMVLVNQSFISTGAYIKLEGSLKTNLVPGASPETIVRTKYMFFKDRADAQDNCSQLFTSTGTYKVKISLVRTLFTMELSTYPSVSGDSDTVTFNTSEMPFSKWYDSEAEIGKDTFTINTNDESQCEQQMLNAGAQFEILMRAAPDYIKAWDDAN